MTKYRKKPVVIDAMQFKGPDGTLENGPSHEWLEYSIAFDDWIIDNQGDVKCRYVGPTLVIPTLEGDMTAMPGDWIIKGVKGELYPIKSDVFELTYEAVE